MPPPATPASQLKKNASKTPVSGLDLRASITPFETPSRPRRKQTLGPKRPQEDEDDERPSKKRCEGLGSEKRVRSVRSEFVLDAGGLPSSPAGPVLGY